MGLAWRARAAVLKGPEHAGLRRLRGRQDAWSATQGVPPEALTMGVVGALALGVNVLVAVLLYAFREGDANMRSVWLCSRNDAIGNVAVMLAALGVFGTGTRLARPRGGGGDGGAGDQRRLVGAAAGARRTAQRQRRSDNPSRCLTTLPPRFPRRHHRHAPRRRRHHRCRRHRSRPFQRPAPAHRLHRDPRARRRSGRRRRARRRARHARDRPARARQPRAAGACRDARGRQRLGPGGGRGRDALARGARHRPRRALRHAADRAGRRAVRPAGRRCAHPARRRGRLRGLRGRLARTPRPKATSAPAAARWWASCSACTAR